MGELDHDESSFGPPLIGVNGVPLKMYFHRAKGSSWTHAIHIAAPSTYTVSPICYTAINLGPTVLYIGVSKTRTILCQGTGSP